MSITFKAITGPQNSFFDIVLADTFSSLLQTATTLAIELSFLIKNLYMYYNLYSPAECLNFIIIGH